MTTIGTEPLLPTEFLPFGQIIETGSRSPIVVNQGNCERFHDLVNVDIVDGRAGISIFNTRSYEMPLKLAMLERHPLGSQAFIPMNDNPFLVVVAAQNNGTPDRPRAFLTNGSQGVNYHRNVWHAVLTPLDGNGLFAVVDRIGKGSNLEEYWFDNPYQIRQTV